MTQIAFNAADYTPAVASSPQLPVSEKDGHPVVITNSEIIENAAKTGGFLALTLTVTEGPSQGESGLYRLNIFNASAKAVEIAYGQLSAVCHVVGVMNIADSAQLHNIPFRAVVGMQKGENPEGYTEVKGVLHMDGSKPGQAGTAAPAAAPAAAAAPAVPAAPAGAPAGAPAAAAPPAWGATGTAAAPAGAAGAAAPPWGAPPA